VLVVPAGSADMDGGLAAHMRYPSKVMGIKDLTT
jgi:hypothetical protein